MGHLGSHFVLCALALSAIAAGAAEPFVIARRGAEAGCGIVVSSNADECVRYAAKELRDYTKRMTGVELPIVNAALFASPPPKAIVLLGGTACPHAAERRAGDNAPCHPDGFRLCVSNGWLYVTGGGSRGVLYGVYELLERFGGCGWFAPWCETVPEREVFEVPGDLDFSDAPAFDSRNTTWRELNRDKENVRFAARLRYNGRQMKPEQGGPAVVYAKAASDGAIGRIVPPKEYFDKHPEWYCEIDGRRQAKSGNWQICYSNPELVKFVAEVVKERLRSVPGANATSIAQNDCGGWCRCAACAACAKEEGSQSGPNIKFANAVAEEVEKEFPDAMIVTFAYQHTRHAPKHIKPRHNVMVVLCSFECSFSEPFEVSRHKNTARFCEDLRKWGAICPNLRIYDYCTNFRNYLFPFPDLFALAPNYRLFRENGVRWLGSQGNGSGYHGEFAELRCWLQAKLMWNPDQPVWPLIDRFLVGYYGEAAAPFVKEYIKKLYAAYRISTEDLSIHDPDESAVWSGIYSERLPISEAQLAEMAALWRKAEEAVKDDPERLYNVKMGTLPLVYFKLKERYEDRFKSVWVTKNPEKFIAGMESLKPLATEFISLRDEAKARKRDVSLAEGYKSRHLVLLHDFGALQDWKPPTDFATSVVVTTNSLRQSKLFGWNLPIRLIAADEGAKYRVRAHLRLKESSDATYGTEISYAYAAGLMVPWLPKAKGSTRKEFGFDKVTKEWAWHDVGEFDFAELQKIPRPTMDGLCLYIQGDVEIAEIEIEKTK